MFQSTCSIDSEEFQDWFQCLQAIVDLEELTRHPLDENDFIDYFLDGYSVEQTVEELLS